MTLVEQQTAVGGNAGSFLHNGIWLDFGSHRLHSASDPRILEDIKNLLGDDLKILFQPFGVSAAAAMATGLISTAVVMTGGLLSGIAAFLLGRRLALPGSTVVTVRQ